MNSSVFSKSAVLVLTLFMSLGCAGVAQISFFDGVCGSEFDRCMKRCQSRTDTSPCEMHCRFRGKLCSRSQALSRSSGRSIPTQGLTDQVELVDLSAFNPLVSEGIKLVLSPGVQRAKQSKTVSGETVYYRVLPPGESMDMDIRVPDTVDQAELVVRHGSAGKVPPCLITISMGKESLAGRYSPPRKPGGTVTLDRWDVSIPIARAESKDGHREVKLFILNNGIAGSQDDYVIKSVELYYQVPLSDTKN